MKVDDYFVWNVDVFNESMLPSININYPHVIFVVK